MPLPTTPKSSKRAWVIKNLNKRRWRRQLLLQLLRRSTCVALIGIVFAALLHPWLRYGTAHLRSDRLWSSIMFSVMLVVATFVLMFLIDHCDTHHILIASVFTSMYWLTDFVHLMAINAEIDWNEPMLSSSLCDTAGQVRVFGWAPWAFSVFCFQTLIYDRARALQNAVDFELSLRLLRILHQILAGIYASLAVVGAVAVSLECLADMKRPTEPWVKMIALLVYGIEAVVFLLFGKTAVAVFRKPVSMLGAVSERLDLARVAAKSLRMQLVGIRVGFCSTILVAATYTVFQVFPWMWGLVAVVHHIDTVLALASVLLLSGVLNLGRNQSGRRVAELRRQLHRRGVEWKATGDARWDEKVVELAHRGFTVGKLVDFWRNLRTLMPHFDPKRHTTKDVTWQVIIPGSAATGQAYASVMMDGQPTKPTKMVTHTWSNLFRDLVAAVVADALEETTYGIIGWLLETDPEKISAMLSSKGCEQKTYWICSFSVAQHSAICDSAQGDDTVTLQPLPSCNCGRPKYHSTSPPVGTDGMSVWCEMNKFVDMMAWLAADNESFEQVIAIDPHCQLFNRAWCIAEIGKANGMHMKQHLKFRWHTGVKRNRKDLSHLDVRKMRASRKEDVDLILDIIGDAEAFNRRLHKLIFDPTRGLMTQWEHSDAKAQMEVAGRLINWLDICGNDPGALQAITNSLTGLMEEVSDGSTMGPRIQVPPSTVQVDLCQVIDPSSSQGWEVNEVII